MEVNGPYRYINVWKKWYDPLMQPRRLLLAIFSVGRVEILLYQYEKLVLKENQFCPCFEVDRPHAKSGQQARALADP